MTVEKNKVFSGHQPTFLPYMGYFYKMFKSDVFVLDDDVQYSKAEYQNFNYLKINGEKKKITIPVNYEFGDTINNVNIFYGNWTRKLLRSVETNYCHTKYYDEAFNVLKKEIEAHHETLSELNVALIKNIARNFGLTAEIVMASDIPTKLTKNERNIYQCKTLGCNVYYSGLGGKNYNDHDLYKQNGIEIVYTDYKPVEYKQKGDFIENLSVLDYIAYCGYELPKEWVK